MWFQYPILNMIGEYPAQKRIQKSAISAGRYTEMTSYLKTGKNLRKNGSGNTFIDAILEGLNP